MAGSIGAVPVLLFLKTSTTGMFSYLNVAIFWSFAMVFLVLSRVVYAGMTNILRDRSVRNCLIVGSGPIAVDLWLAVGRQSVPQYEVAGFVDNPGPHTKNSAVRERIIGRIADLEAILKRTPVDDVLIGLPVKSCYAHIQRVIRVCELVGVQCTIPSLTFSCSIARPEVESPEPSHYHP